jgi:hypothetical protein
MKRTAQIQVVKAENGYSINFNTDEMGKNRKLIAKDEAEVKSLVTGIVNNDLFAVAATPSLTPPATGG